MSLTAEELKRREAEKKLETETIQALLKECQEKLSGASMADIVKFVETNQSRWLPVVTTYSMAHAFSWAHHERLNSREVATTIKEFSDEKYDGNWRQVLEKRKTAEYDTLTCARGSVKVTSEFERHFEYALYSEKYRSIQTQMSFTERKRVFDQIKDSLGAAPPGAELIPLKLWYIRLEAAPSYSLRGDILIAAAPTRLEAIRCFLDRLGEPLPGDVEEEYHLAYLKTLAHSDSIIELALPSQPGIVYEDGYVGTE